MKYQALFTTCLIQVACAQTDDSIYEGIWTDDDHAPAEFIAGYIKEILKEDYADEIKKCYTIQDGLKDTVDTLYVGLNNPDKQKQTYLNMRKESFYPVVTAALKNCPNALPAWTKIQDRIDSIDQAMLENIWDHCYIKCGWEQSLSTKEWKIHDYSGAGWHWAGAGDDRFYNQGGVSEEIEPTEVETFLQ